MVRNSIAESHAPHLPSRGRPCYGGLSGDMCLGSWLFSDRSFSVCFGMFVMNWKFKGLCSE